MDGLVRSVLIRSVDGEVRTTEPAPTGNSKRTTFATLADGREVVVQDAPGTRLATETTLWRAIAERTAVPVAPILAAGEATTEDGELRSYVVCERVEGTDLHVTFTDLAPAERQAVAKRLGAALGELHATFTFEGYGEVVATDAGLQVTDRSADWREWFEGYLTAGLAALAPELADLAADLRAAVDLATLPEHPPAVLFPWDLRPGNAVYDAETGKLAAVLDWGAPLAADPALSLAKAEYLLADWYVPEEAGRLREAFRGAYATRHEVPGVPHAYRYAAVVQSATDSRGEVTRPGYPERRGADAVAFQREQLRALVDESATEVPGSPDPSAGDGD
jgi:aminoglycoside phosphotransferase (APT) family kinase protein